MGILYIVGTPIGNLKDITFRAIETLQNVDFIIAEDTRVTLKLLNHYSIKKTLVSYHRHSDDSTVEKIVHSILDGKNAALCSDAGMPVISDPGDTLISKCIEQNIAITTVPGPVAFASAIALSNFDCTRFCFEGFLSVNKKNRKAHLDKLKDEERTMIFYEAPHKLEQTLLDFCATFGENRKIVIARELTKLHEECLYLSMKEALEKAKRGAIKGEIVLLVKGATIEKKAFTLEEAVNLALRLKEDGLKLSEACSKASEQSHIAKSMIYKSIVKRKLD